MLYMYILSYDISYQITSKISKITMKTRALSGVVLLIVALEIEEVAATAGDSPHGASHAFHPVVSCCQARPPEWRQCHGGFHGFPTYIICMYVYIYIYTAILNYLQYQLH